MHNGLLGIASTVFLWLGATARAAEPAPATTTELPEGSAPEATEPVPIAEPSQPAPSWVPDEVWSIAHDKDVVLELDTGGELRGKLASQTPTSVVLIAPDGRILAVEKSTVTGLRLEERQPAPTHEPEPEPIPPTSSPPPETSSEPSRPTRSRSDDEFARFGFFIAQGVGFAHWSGRDNQGTIAYAADLGVGYNVSERFGLYAQGGGLFAGRLFDREVKANFGRLAASMVGRGKYLGGSFGMGLGFSSLVATADHELAFRDLGLVFPLKLQGYIPLPRRLYMGIGLGYDFGAFQSFRIIFNGISGTISFGRW